MYRWLSAALIVAPVLACVQQAYSQRNGDTVYVVTVDNSKPSRDAAYLARFNDKGVDNAWFTSQVSHGSRAVRIVGVDAKECEKKQVEFLFLSNAPVNGTPPSVTVRGRWFRPDMALSQGHNDSTVRITGLGAVRITRDTSNAFLRSAGQYCYTSIRWRLSDNPGENTLRARLIRKDDALVDSDVALKTVTDFRAVGHAPPALIVGLALNAGGIHGVEPILEDSSPAQAKADSIKKSRPFQPILGVDFPLIWPFGGSYEFQDALSHFRPVVATSYGDPGWDLYTGLEVSPALHGARALANPFQLSTGVRWGLSHSKSSFYVAGHFNALGAISSFLSGIGIK